MRYSCISPHKGNCHGRSWRVRLSWRRGRPPPTLCWVGQEFRCPRRVQPARPGRDVREVFRECVEDAGMGQGPGTHLPRQRLHEQGGALRVPAVENQEAAFRERNTLSPVFGDEVSSTCYPLTIRGPTGPTGPRAVTQASERTGGPCSPPPWPGTRQSFMS